jgi:hypothetical protein
MKNMGSTKSVVLPNASVIVQPIKVEESNNY